MKQQQHSVVVSPLAVARFIVEINRLRVVSHVSRGVHENATRARVKIILHKKTRRADLAGRHVASPCVR